MKICRAKRLPEPEWMRLGCLELLLQSEPLATPLNRRYARQFPTSVVSRLALTSRFRVFPLPIPFWRASKQVQFIGFVPFTPCFPLGKARPLSDGSGLSATTVDRMLTLRSAHDLIACFGTRLACSCLPEAKQDPIWSFPKAMTWIATRDFLPIARMRDFRRGEGENEPVATDGVTNFNTKALGWLQCEIAFNHCECGAQSELDFKRSCTCSMHGRIGSFQGRNPRAAGSGGWDDVAGWCGDFALRRDFGCGQRERQVQWKRQRSCGRWPLRRMNAGNGFCGNLRRP